MALTENQVAEMARHELRIPNASRNLGLMMLIPRAIERLATSSVQDESKKHLFLTPVSTIVTLDGNGKADLSTILSTNKVLLEFIDRGLIMHNSSPEPLEYIQNPAMVQMGVCEDDTLFYWLRGRILHTQNKKALVGTPLSGNLTLELPYVPNLASFPEEMTMDLVGKVAELATSPRNDYAEDGRG